MELCVKCVSAPQAERKNRKNAVLLANEVEALYTNGPAGGGGAVKRVSEIVSVCSIFVPRDAVRSKSYIPGGIRR